MVQTAFMAAATKPNPTARNYDERVAAQAKEKAKTAPSNLMPASMRDIPRVG